MTGMRMYINELNEDEQLVLTHQLKNSPFWKCQQDRRPVVLDIFDFDSTLFLSPLLSPNLWHSSFVNCITQENLLGPGWWRDIRSLKVAGTWSDYWNEDIVEKVKASSDDPKHMTVLLTGRRYYPFHTLIESMLASRGLQFDLIGLRPDPITDGSDRPVDLMFNDEPDVFNTTMEFKTSFIVNILNTIPSLREIVMWDDRASHICVFEQYLKDMVGKGIIKRGEVVCVKPSRPKYNPSWELETVTEIINTHNDAILRMRQLNKKLKDRVAIRNLGQTFTSCGLYKLDKLDSHIVLQLSKETQDHLYALFKPIYSAEQNSQAEWKMHHAEMPIFFGNQVLLAEKDKKLDDFNLKVGTHVDFNILQRSKITSTVAGLALRVKIPQLSTPFVLPLWYKPSEFNLLIDQNYEWIDLEETLHLNKQLLHGTVGYHQLFILQTIE